MPCVRRLPFTSTPVDGALASPSPQTEQEDTIEWAASPSPQTEQEDTIEWAESPVESNAEQLFVSIFRLILHKHTFVLFNLVTCTLC